MSPFDTVGVGGVVSRSLVICKAGEILQACFSPVSFMLPVVLMQYDETSRTSIIFYDTDFDYA